MVTCVIDYIIDADQLEAFERYATAWMEKVVAFGGEHHGYYLPSEGASDRAMALFSFPSFAAYEGYREKAAADDACCALLEEARELRLIVRHERTFMRPVSSLNVKP